MSYKKQGFTLIEAIVYIAIASILVSIITQIFISQSQVYDIQTSQTDIELYAKNALNRIVTNSVSALGVVETHTFGGTAYYSSTNTLILKLQSIDASQNLLTSKYDYVVFYRDQAEPTKLYMKIDADPSSSRQTVTVLLANFVETLNFRYNTSIPADATKVDIALNFIKTVRNKTTTAEAATAIFFKNKF